MKTTCTGMATIYLAACIVSVAAVRMEPNGGLDDKGITAAINIELLYDNEVVANEVDVETKQGIVSLTGSVDSILAKERAQSLAAAVKGVRSVVNRIKVVPTVACSDEELARRVQQALLRDPAADSFELQVHVESGCVTLEGTVESFAEKELSGTVAKSIAGVVGLKNNIVVDYATARTDSEIEVEVVARLENDIRVDDNLVEVRVTDGKVGLAGTVGSLQERIQAFADAWVAGVKAVDTDKLEVEWWARDRMRRKSAAVARTDVEIEAAVGDALRYDPRVPAGQVGVSVDLGVATLSGSVDNLRAKGAAAQDAHNTLGIWRVVNNLKVRPEIPDDEELEKRVAEKLLDDALANRFDIAVKADHGWVTLAGDVETSYESQQAELAVHAVKGVVGVRNKIKFDRVWHWQPDRELKEAVLDQLFWSVFVESDDISVSVRNGVVTLSGTVSSWGEYDDAEKNAYQAGAKHVQNKLEVELPDYQGPYGPRYFSPPYPGGYPVPYYLPM